MPRRHQVVIVAQNPALATALLSWLGAAGYELGVATTFSAGKGLLATLPSLMIAEVKLGEYNGLHLAMKAVSLGIPSIVIGPRDKVLERDAADLGVLYLGSVLRRRHLLETIASSLAASPAETPVAIRRQSPWRLDTESDSSPLHATHSRTVLH
jgi:DNA-binding response OmpR family regulator